MPTNNNATISREVATGRKMNVRDGLKDGNGLESDGRLTNQSLCANVGVCQNPGLVSHPNYPVVSREQALAGLPGSWGLVYQPPFPGF